MLYIICIYSYVDFYFCISPDGDTDYFDIVAGVLQGDTLRIIDLMKENDFKLAKE